MFNRRFEELKFIQKEDPAARSIVGIILTYPGLHALWGYRLSHLLWSIGLKGFSRWLSFFFRFLTGIDIHPGAKIGKNLFIDHGMGVVIGETAEIGDEVMIYQGVTLGSVGHSKGKRHPTIGNKVMIGAGAKVLGPITIGDHCRIGANAVVLKSSPSNSIVVGVPGQIILPSKSHEKENHSFMPDAIGQSLISAFKRLERLEKHVKLPEEEKKADMHLVSEGIWSGEDFSI